MKETWALYEYFSCDFFSAACIKYNIPRLVYTSTFNVVFGGQKIENGDESLPYFPIHKVANLQISHYHYKRSAIVNSGRRYARMFKNLCLIRLYFCSIRIITQGLKLSQSRRSWPPTVPHSAAARKNCEHVHYVWQVSTGLASSDICPESSFVAFRYPRQCYTMHSLTCSILELVTPG